MINNMLERQGRPHDILSTRKGRHYATQRARDNVAEKHERTNYYG